MKMPEYVAVKIMPDKKGTSYNLEVVTDADFVNVVRCKDCKYSEPYDGSTKATLRLKCLYRSGVLENWFCEHGERR